jgi:hypothetical protein
MICLPSLVGTVRPVHAASLPDLTVASIWLEEASNPGQPVPQVAPSDQFLIVASIKNLGNATASGYYIDVYYDNDYGRGGPDNIAAGETQIWYVGAFTAVAGTHTTKWVVDPDNQIVESNETNNELDYTFTIGSQTTNTTTTVTLTPPVVTVPADMTVNATGPSGAVVKFSASASDVVDGAITPSCSPASGSTFAIGSTTVTCTAKDKAGLTGSASFKVTVVDKTPPKLTLPSDMTVQATNSSGAVVKFSASDLVDGSVPVTCNPASGSTFPVGITTVTCSAKDKAGNSASGSFKVTVTPTSVTVTVKLLGSNGKGLSGGVVQYYSGAWKSFGTTGSNGTVSLALLLGTYSFQISWAGASQQKSQNVATNPTVVFQTTLVTMSLISSTNAQLSGGAQYYAGSWKTFGKGTTPTTMELLPLTYTFQISYAGASQQVSQNVATSASVVFKTTLVTMKIQSSTNTTLSGTAQYYAGGWKTFGSGTTTTSMELLPLTYSFQVSYASASQQVSQNVGSNANVIFQTVQVHSDSGKCTSYNAGGWKTFTQDMQLLPGTYTFRFSDGTKDTSYALVVGAVKHIH